MAARSRAAAALIDSDVHVDRKRAMSVEKLRLLLRPRRGHAYAAKSLCDLAMEAKALGHHEFQLDLTQRAVGQNPEDGWAWAQHGDALLNNGRLPDAV